MLTLNISNPYSADDDGRARNYKYLTYIKKKNLQKENDLFKIIILLFST